MTSERLTPAQMQQLERQLVQTDHVRLYRRTLALLLWGRGSAVAESGRVEHSDERLDRIGRFAKPLHNANCGPSFSRMGGDLELVGVTGELEHILLVAPALAGFGSCVGYDGRGGTGVGQGTSVSPGPGVQRG